LVCTPEDDRRSDEAHNQRLRQRWTVKDLVGYGCEHCDTAARDGDIDNGCKRALRYARRTAGKLNMLVITRFYSGAGRFKLEAVQERRRRDRLQLFRHIQNARHFRRHRISKVIDLFPSN
jgi:hypothetical protein